MSDREPSPSGLRVRMASQVTVTAVCALAALLIAAPSALAGAGDDAHVVVITQSVNDNQMGIAAPTCGFGERAVGGGVGFRRFQNNWIVSSGPTNQGGHRDSNDGDIPRGWHAAIYNDTGSTVNYSFYAICSPSSDATIQVEDIPLDQARPGPIADFSENTVQCPTGQVAVGGGTARVRDPTSLTRIEQSGPLDETGQTANTETGDAARYWYAGIRNFDTVSAPILYKVYALCSPTSTATLRVAAETLNSADLSVNLACPSGSRALSGGAVSPETNRTFMISSGPATSIGPGGLASGDVATAWFSEIHHFGGTALGNTIKFSVLCEGPTPATAATAPPVVAETGERAAALKRCKKKAKKKDWSRKRLKKCRRSARKLPL